MSNVIFFSTISCLSHPDEGMNDSPATPTDSFQGYNDFARTTEPIGDSAVGNERSSQSTARGAQSDRTGFTIHRMKGKATALYKRAS
ncbi:hypothetical protein FRB94_004892 [Tulasnella sp. JGI-2019a]|nr:hypothetical protein FRB94_004892 [Tulasnella sp. JGI-2019a]